MDGQPFAPPNTPAPPPARPTGAVVVPTFVSVTDCDGAVPPTGTLPKSIRVDDTSTGGATPVPVRWKVKASPLRKSVGVADAGPTSVGVNR